VVLSFWFIYSRYDYYVDPPSRTENVVRDVRISVEKVKDDCQPFFDKVSHIYNTGVAHTNGTILKLITEVILTLI